MTREKHEFKCRIGEAQIQWNWLSANQWSTDKTWYFEQKTISIHIDLLSYPIYSAFKLNAEDCPNISQFLFFSAIVTFILAASCQCFYGSIDFGQR